jgi:hypothetical protein
LPKEKIEPKKMTVEDFKKILKSAIARKLSKKISKNSLKNPMYSSVEMPTAKNSYDKLGSS